jgi:amino acid transporter
MNLRKIKIIYLLLPFFLFVFSFNLLSANYGLDATVGVKDDKLKQAFRVKDVDNNDSFISSRLGILIGAALSFIGIIFMVLIIYGGLLWMTARGNDQQVEKAKNLITQSFIGLIIILAAYAITAYIGEQLVGQQATTED